MPEKNDDNNFVAFGTEENTQHLKRQEITDSNATKKMNKDLAFKKPQSGVTQAKSHKKLEGNFVAFERQKPQKTVEHWDDFDSQMPQTNAANATTCFVAFETSSGWEDLWRMEKNGNYYTWRLRFARERRTKPGGKVTKAIKRKLEKRPGKGRHSKSRGDAERLRRRAELTAISLRPGSGGRNDNQKQSVSIAGQYTSFGHLSEKRKSMSKMSELDNGEELSSVRIM